MRSALFGVIRQRIVVIPYRRFGTTYRSHLQGWRKPRQFSSWWIKKSKLSCRISLILKMRRIWYPETSVRNCNYSLRKVNGTDRVSRNVGKELLYTLRNSYEEHRLHLFRVGCLKSCLEVCGFNRIWEIPLSVVGSVAFNLLKSTGHVMHQQFNISTTVRSAHTVFVCFVFIWEQTASCATYSLNWLVFITEMKSVYSAVRTGSLNTAVCASSIKD